MQFVQQPAEAGQAALTQTLLGLLQQGKKVLWLVPGGSNIRVAAAVMHDLLGHEQNLTVTLSDERYGKPGHADSNWQQLMETGFRTGSATIYPVIHEGLTLQETAQAFAAFLAGALEAADTVVGHLGMGADGHIAGILPYSPASMSEELAAGYHTEQFERVTVTFAALRRLHIAFCLAYGEDKRPALLRLQGEELPLPEQPAQILKTIDQAYVYNDQTGE